MVGIILASICWGVWFLTPERVEILGLSRAAVDSGQFWRLWSATLTNSSLMQLMVESVVIVISGLILEAYIRWWHMVLGIFFAVPVMNWLLIHFEPAMSNYHGATGLAAMFWTLAVCFLVVECKRFSFPYMLGQAMLLIAAARLAFETWLIFYSHREVPLDYRIFWDMDICGALIGVALFNGLHQIYKARIENRARPLVDQDGKPIPMAMNRARLQQGQQPARQHAGRMGGAHPGGAQKRPVQQQRRRAAPPPR